MNLIAKVLIKTLFKIIKTMFNLDNITKKDDNTSWPYTKLIIGPSGSGQTNYLLNSIQKDNNIIDKIYLYAKVLETPKYQFLIERREKKWIRKFQCPAPFIEYSNKMDDIYDDINDYSKKGREKF